MKHIILIVSLLMGVTLGVQAQPKALFERQRMNLELFYGKIR
jgi:hypothetical protein